MPKATQKLVADVDEAEEETPLHGAINEEDAKRYRKGLDKVFDDLAKNIKDNIANAMELAIIDPSRYACMYHVWCGMKDTA